MEQICSTPAVHDLISNDFKELATANKLNSLECPKKLYLHNEVFTEANDLITPTQKIKRNIAQEKFRAEIDQLYSS